MTAGRLHPVAILVHLAALETVEHGVSLDSFVKTAAMAFELAARKPDRNSGIGSK